MEDATVKIILKRKVIVSVVNADKKIIIKDTIMRHLTVNEKLYLRRCNLLE